MSNEFLKIQGLTVAYKADDGMVAALNGIHLTLAEGSTLGLVGETGAGKTTLAKSIMGLIPSPPGKVTGGEILFQGKDLVTISPGDLRQVRGKQISMIFQDPMTSLNPVMTVGEQIEEVILTHEKLPPSECRKKAGEMLELVGIPVERAGEYPHQFSGGMKQRVVIAIALACNPKLLIADEPTTALDVTIQAQVLEMMRELKQRLGTSMILITHDLGVVAQNCDYVGIVYAGEVIEYGTLRDVFKDPKHPYTEGLFGSIPNLVQDVRRLRPIEGQMPDPTHLPSGCKFHPRCQYAQPRCSQELPPEYMVGGEHQVRCFKYDEKGAL